MAEAKDSLEQKLLSPRTLLVKVVTSQRDDNRE